MFLLTYYDDKDCLVTTLGRPFPNVRGTTSNKARRTESFKAIWLQNPKALFQKAQKESGFSLDSDSDIELYVEPSVV